VSGPSPALRRTVRASACPNARTVRCSPSSGVPSCPGTGASTLSGRMQRPCGSQTSPASHSAAPSQPALQIRSSQKLPAPQSASTRQGAPGASGSSSGGGSGGRSGPGGGAVSGSGPVPDSEDEEVVSSSWATSPCEQATSASAAAEWSSGFRVTAIAPHGAPGARKQRTVFESR
jgi:hypothetical protein